MFGNSRRWKCAGTATLIVVLHLTLAAERAWGQVEVKLRDNDTGIWPWLVSLGLTILVGSAVFMNSKRTHLD